MSDDTTPRAKPRRFLRRPGIGLRLLLAQALVLAVGAIATWAIAAVVGPRLFQEHMHRAVPVGSFLEIHAGHAYRYATTYAVGGALAISALLALAVSWYVSRRLQRSIAEVAAAATEVARGRYDIRVSPIRLDEDFDTLVDSFNQMAARLQTVDATRRQLFGDLAHEIRTPVSVLEAYVDALEDGVRSLTPQTTAMLRDQTRRLVRFSEDTAALAQAEESAFSMAFDLIDVREMIDVAVTAAQERYRGKHVDLVVALPANLPPLRGDPQRLSQVLGNLLDNALRHTPPGGRVEVRAAVDGSELALSVVDSGEGIPAEHLPHVFERFYRADLARDRGYGGGGIGLAIVKALVEAHNGRVAAASDGIGKGAAFTVTLPLAASAAERTRETVVSGERASST
ncbi:MULTISPECIES: sensor histidine kinase [Mycobacterium]|jgi:signal transduction histidine kinase|uniref:histidine kinase n=1 Tax=Mycobacterium gordonae TaxID=1778 RepID=A0A1A6BLA1_MYCGO|nr:MULTISPECIES: ATP-binding protein [Mycobacterium]MBI2698861.1 HAMP domain-containing protein [Mycobacterium sp.]MBX9981008.1 HAMP domain-containing protein [Mycobacterium gordonae]MCV7009006.1 HAMP domain-containing protein [Mycobacterium gordonae]OBS03113.1 two-component sensor histidine kinase [Mycobacterium gordonae]ODR23026.1 two-component sensor histidine kinase [Mycobacterium gordonae]